MKPKIILVDREDNVLGSIVRSEITHTDYFRVAALWLTDQHGNVLIAQRKLDKLNDPGKWGPAAAGTVEVNETYESNIYKEAAEELGLDGIGFQLGPHQFVEDVRSFHCQWFTGVADHSYQFELQDEEVETVTWISPKDLNHDLTIHPDKYVNSMVTAVKLFGI